MDDREKIDIASESSIAIHKFVSRFTISLLDTGKRPMELCSGTLVEIGNRVFVATAKHCVPPDPNGRLWILPASPHSMNDGMLGFTRFRRHPHFDVAYLELDCQSCLQYLPSHTPAKLGQLSNVGCGRATRPITVCGSPVQFVGGDGDQATPLKAANTAFSTVPISLNEFPTVPPGYRPADDSVDIFFEYPTEALLLTDRATIGLTTPEGFSGGGVWDQGFETDVIWSVEKAKLVGIASVWNEGERYSRAIQVKHWLRLLWCDVRDCRPDLEVAFPDEHFTDL